MNTAAGAPMLILAHPGLKVDVGPAERQRIASAHEAPDAREFW